MMTTLANQVWQVAYFASTKTDPDSVFNRSATQYGLEKHDIYLFFQLELKMTDWILPDMAWKLVSGQAYCLARQDTVGQFYPSRMVLLDPIPSQIVLEASKVSPTLLSSYGKESYPSKEPSC